MPVFVAPRKTTFCRIEFNEILWLLKGARKVNCGHEIGIRLRVGSHGIEIDLLGAKLSYVQG